MPPACLGLGRLLPALRFTISVDQEVVYPNIKNSQLPEVYIHTYQSPAHITWWVLRLPRKLVSHFPVGLAQLGTTSRQNPCFCLLSTDMVPFQTVQITPFGQIPQIYFREGKKNATGQETYSTSFPSAITHLTFWPNCETAKLNLKVQKPYTFSRSLSHHNTIH